MSFSVIVVVLLALSLSCCRCLALNATSVETFPGAVAAAPFPGVSNSPEGIFAAYNQPDVGGMRFLFNAATASMLFQYVNGLHCFTRPSTAAAADVSFSGPTPLSSPDMQEFITLPEGNVAVDCHVHTYSHDSFTNIRTMLMAAARRGLSGIAVTDNDRIAGAERTAKIAQKMKKRGDLPADFFVIKGEEVSSRQGHILALFITRQVPAGLTATDTLDAIHESGGLAVAVRPLQPDGVHELANILPFDAVETMNGGELRMLTSATDAVQADHCAFCARVTKTRLGGSDAHDPPVIGCCYTLVQSAPCIEAVRAAMLAGKTTPGVLQSAVRNGLLARKSLWDALNSLYSNASALLNQADGWLAHATHMDNVSISPTIPPGIMFTKNF